MRYRAAAVLVWFSLSASLGAELTIQTDFPGGAAELRRLDAAGGEIELSPPGRNGRGWPCWWYFRIDGATPGQVLTVTVTATEQPFRDSQRLAANWSLPARAAVSADDVHWTQTDPGTITPTSGVYRVAAPAERFWLAWGPPFLPTHADALLDEIQQRVPGSQRFVLAETRGGRPVQAIRLGGEVRPDAVWVQARQHAWESGGSWVGRGFIDWVASDDPAALALRERTEITFIPIMDVDSVTEGAGGKEAVPRDHNRDWGDEPVYPEVAAAQRGIMERISAGRLRAYLDLHNPGSGDRRPFYFGPFNYELLEPRHRRLFDRFLELSIEHIGPPLPITPQYRFATYVKTDEERGRMSAEWVRRRAGEGAIAMTLETAWNTPDSTQAGYQAVGRGLARTLAAYLAEAPYRAGAQ